MLVFLHQPHRAVVRHPTAQGPQFAGTFGPHGPQDGRQLGPPLHAGAQDGPQGPQPGPQPDRQDRRLPRAGTSPQYGQQPLRNGRYIIGPGGNSPT